MRIEESAKGAGFDGVLGQPREREQFFNEEREALLKRVANGTTTVADAGLLARILPEGTK